MKRLWPVLILALAAAIATYMLHSRQKAAAESKNAQQWLRREFALNETQEAAIEQLERNYRPICDAHCADYMAAHDRLEALLSKNVSWEPEIGRAMETVYRIQMECHRDMLKHAYEVSAVMAPEQGQRYLGMILGRLSLTAPDELQRSTR